MERHGEEVDVTTTEARQGSTPHIVRYVLLISVFLAAAALTVVWVTGALTVDDEAEERLVRDDSGTAEDDFGLEGDADITAADTPMVDDYVAGEAEDQAE